MEDFNDDVDFKGLQKEMKNAVFRDEKYQRENDAKFRAVNQKVASYEEFRDIVEASHLKSLDRKDKLGGMSYQKWNSISEGSKNSEVKISENLKVKNQNLDPKNYEEFMKLWKHFKPKEKVDFLIIFDLISLESCFKIECPLGEIISVLAGVLETENYQKIIEILQVMTKSKRFTLQLSFLNKSELDILEKLFQSLENNLKEDLSFIEIKKLYKM